MSLFRNTTLCALAAILMVAAGCAKHGLSTDPSLVRFTSSAKGFEVKATDVTLSDNDEVGIFAGEPIGVGNVRGVVSGKSIFPDEEIYWEEGQTVATRFCAYSPYLKYAQQEMFPFTVAEDQTKHSAYIASDIRTASVTVSPGNVVNFIFEHRLSKLMLDIDSDGRAVSEVSLVKVFRTCSVNVASGEIFGVSDPGPVKAGRVAVSADSESYVAVFMPETARLEVVVTADGKKYNFALEEPQEFLSGCAYTASLKLEDTPPGDNTVGFAVSVTDWESGEPMDFMREQ